MINLLKNKPVRIIIFGLIFMTFTVCLIIWGVLFFPNITSNAIMTTINWVMESNNPLFHNVDAERCKRICLNEYELLDNAINNPSPMLTDSDIEFFKKCAKDCYKFEK